MTKTSEEIARLEIGAAEQRNERGQAIVLVLNDTYPEYVSFSDLARRVVKLGNTRYPWPARWFNNVMIWLNDGLPMLSSFKIENLLEELAENDVVENRRGFFRINANHER